MIIYAMAMLHRNNMKISEVAAAAASRRWPW